MRLLFTAIILIPAFSFWSLVQAAPGQGPLQPRGEDGPPQPPTQEHQLQLKKVVPGVEEDGVADERILGVEENQRHSPEEKEIPIHLRASPRSIAREIREREREEDVKYMLTVAAKLKAKRETQEEQLRRSAEEERRSRREHRMPLLPTFNTLLARQRRQRLDELRVLQQEQVLYRPRFSDPPMVTRGRRDYQPAKEAEQGHEGAAPASSPHDPHAATQGPS